MSIKVNFEIGHEASIRTKRTLEGFTHDWEVVVRGTESSDISHFVDKVVFQLHDTFPKPKRVVKEPPYCIKETGYAGFNLPIEIHFKNRDEPKFVRYNYDLSLQPSGPAIIKVQKEKYVFQNPPDDFKRKLLKGGGMITGNPFPAHPAPERDRNGRDSPADDRSIQLPPQLIGKPKLGGDRSKKQKSKERRPEDAPRPSSNFTDLFGTPIQKTSRVSPESERPLPISKAEKKDKEKSHAERDRPKARDGKEKEGRDEKSKISKEEKDKSKDERRSRPQKERESEKEKSTKRPAERLPSPAPPVKRHNADSNMSNKPCVPVHSKEEIKPVKVAESAEIKSKPSRPVVQEAVPAKVDKKLKKEKKTHDKDRETKREHKKDRDASRDKSGAAEIKEIKPARDTPKEPTRERDKPVKPEKPDKPINKFSIENMLKDPVEPVKPVSSDRKERGDKERRHKHKKKDKRRDESREKSKDSTVKEKKHKHEKHSNRERAPADIGEIVDSSDKVEPEPITREVAQPPPVVKLPKEKERIRPVASPVPPEIPPRPVKPAKALEEIVVSATEAITSSGGESDGSAASEDESVSMHSESNSRSAKSSKRPKPPPPETSRSRPPKSGSLSESSKIDKQQPEKEEKPPQPSSHKSQKNKEKSSKHESREEKKQRKRNSGSVKSDDLEKVPKIDDEIGHVSKKRSESSDTGQRTRPATSPRSKTDTKVQDDGVSSSLSDHPSLKCDSPVNEEVSQTIDLKQISPEYIVQLKELQQRIMTIQSGDELERVVNLIAETGKYEINKKTFDFDLCLLDRTTVQQLQELIGCASRA